MRRLLPVVAWMTACGHGAAPAQMSPAPSPVPGIDAARRVAAGGSGTVCTFGGPGATTACWDATTFERSVPKALPAPPAGIVDLAIGEAVSCGRIGDRAVCWGERDRLGDVAGSEARAAAPVQVHGIVLGAARPLAPPEPRPAIVPPPPGRTFDLHAAPMKGPFADRERACASVACPAGRTRDCGIDSATVRSMPAPPEPFLEVGMLAVTCRNPEYRRDESETFRMLVRRADGLWISEPIVTIGDHGKWCAGHAEPRWEARDLVAGGAPEITLAMFASTTCMFPTAEHRSRNDVAFVTAIADGRAPRLYPTVPVAVGAGRVAVRLDAAFAPDGTLAVGGPASWPVPRRDAAGAFTALLDGTALGPTPIGTYRFR